MLVRRPVDLRLLNIKLVLLITSILLHTNIFRVLPSKPTYCSGISQGIIQMLESHNFRRESPLHKWIRRRSIRGASFAAKALGICPTWTLPMFNTLTAFL